MGRAGIKRRKRKRQLPPVDDAPAGIIEDLEDQAEWSSYGQHIPRLGNSHRDAIWWNRNFRFFGGLANADRNETLRGSYFWVAVRAGVILVVGVVALCWVILRVIDFVT